MNKLYQLESVPDKDANSKGQNKERVCGSRHNMNLSQWMNKLRKEKEKHRWVVYNNSQYEYYIVMPTIPLNKNAVEPIKQKLQKSECRS